MGGGDLDHRFPRALLAAAGAARRLPGQTVQEPQGDRRGRGAGTRLQRGGALELLGESERIYDIAALGESQHGAVNPAVPLPIEHCVVKELRRAQYRVGVHEHRRQNRLLRIF